MVSINLTTRGAADMTTVLVRTPPRKYATPLRGSPGVTPVAAKTTSSPRIRSSRASLRSEWSSPYATSFSTCERCVGRQIHLRPALAQRVSDAQDRGPHLERLHPGPLVRALPAQDRHLPRHADPLKLPPASLRGKREGLLRSARALKRRHLEPDALRDGGVLDGYRGCGWARIGHVNGSSTSRARHDAAFLRARSSSNE
jgi:hypothetical protein